MRATFANSTSLRAVRAMDPERVSQDRRLLGIELGRFDLSVPEAPELHEQVAVLARSNRVKVVRASHERSD